MLALKWKDEVKMTAFRGVTLNTTRNGTVSIVGEFDEVTIDGTKIRRASLHNLSNFEKFQFGVAIENGVTMISEQRFAEMLEQNR